ncbi:MAG: two-component regulator propeller domain-containing protein [bacterium]
MRMIKGIELDLRDRWWRFTTEDGLAGNYVRSILEDSKYNLWFGTRKRGVSRYNGQGFKNFTTKDGLASNSVLSQSLRILIIIYGLELLKG